MVRSHLSLFCKLQGTKFSNFRNPCDQNFHDECERFPNEDFALGSTELVVDQQRTAWFERDTYVLHTLQHY